MMNKRLFAYNYCFGNTMKTVALGCTLLINVFTSAAQYAFAAPKKPVSVSQNTLEDKVTLNIKNERLDNVLEKIEKQTGIVFVYANDEVDVSQKVSIAVNDKTLPETVRQLLQPLGIGFMIVKDKIILQPVKQKSPFPEGSNSAGTTTDRAFAARYDNAFAISGKVSDENGKPLALVNVALKGGDVGTSTNPQGNYSLSVDDNQANGTLIFSLVGYVAQERPIGGNAVVNATLLADSKELTDVVVVGYGTQRKVSVTGAVDGINRKVIEV